jgi:hypothetical protein
MQDINGYDVWPEDIDGFHSFAKKRLYMYVSRRNTPMSTGISF